MDDAEIIAHLDRRFAEVNTEIAALDHKLDEMREQNSVRFHAIERRFDAIETRIGKLESDLEHHRETGNGNAGLSRYKQPAIYGGAALGGGGIGAGLLALIERLLG